MLKSLFIASVIFSSVPVFSQDIDPNIVISSVEVHEVPSPVERIAVELPKPTDPLGEVAMYVDGLIAIGKKIWTIVDAGRPVITTDMASSISVLPHLDDEAATQTEMKDMADWSAPKAVSYRVSYKNMVGLEVLGFTYTVFFQYNGSYKGVGKYLTSLKVQASEVSAAWGFNFDATSTLVNVANVGSSADPVASAIIQISYKAKGLINEMRNVQSFYVDGNGTIKSLNN